MYPVYYVNYHPVYPVYYVNYHPVYAVYYVNYHPVYPVYYVNYQPVYPVYYVNYTPDVFELAAEQCVWLLLTFPWGRQQLQLLPCRSLRMWQDVVLVPHSLHSTMVHKYSDTQIQRYMAQPG